MFFGLQLSSGLGLYLFCGLRVELGSGLGTESSWGRINQMRKEPKQSTGGTAAGRLVVGSGA